uniref:Uncharacterized protein n=1 Tax=Leersia perrieri TaxID=77586 RepID=A0A0D9XHR6_9ORYZ
MAEKTSASTIKTHPSPPPPEKPEMDETPVNDDVLREILLRLPPLPTSLIRAGAVCRRWRRVTGEPEFLRRYRAHHGKPPLLGFFVNPRGREPLFRSIMDDPDRLPADRFALRLDEDSELGGNWYYHGCCHGRLLLINWKSGIGCRHILIWDPITGDVTHLSPPPPLAPEKKGVFFQGTVVCANHNDDHVHGDGCRSGPFKVVLVGTDRERAYSFVYSSVTGEWGDVVEIPVDCISIGSRCIQIGGYLYWMLFGYDNDVLEFDLVNQSMDVVDVPQHIHEKHDGLYLIALREGTELGLIAMSGSCVQIWQWLIDYNGVGGWLPAEPIYLEDLLSLRAGECVNPPKVLGYAQEDNVIFVATFSSLFMVHLETLEFKKICNINEFADSPESRPIYAVYPFASFYDAGSSSSSA